MSTLSPVLPDGSSSSPVNADQTLEINTLVWLAAVLLCDLLITSSIMFGLFRSKTGWSKTDQLVNKLLRLCVESQLPPAIMWVHSSPSCVAEMAG